MSDTKNFEWDAFISHATEDKSSFVEPLVAELRKYGLKIWFDKFTLRVGSSLRESIDEGLAESRFGVIVLSHAFFEKNWPKKELNGLFSRQVDGHDVILPIWHDLAKEDLLRYSPLLADIVAAKSNEGPAAVARSLVQVIRPEAFEVETSRVDGQNAAERIREHLKTAHPQLDCRVTFGPQELDPIRTIGTRAPADVIFSRTQQATRIEVFAPDRAAYNSNPISFNLRMTKEAWERFQEAQQKGKLAEFGPDDILGLTSDFFASFGPEGVLSPAVQKLVVAPPAEVMNRKRRFKLTFALGEEAEEFSYVEFEMIRPGQGEIEIRSSAPTLPFQLTLTLNLAGGPSGMEVSYSHAGHEIRKIFKAHRAIQLFMMAASWKCSTSSPTKSCRGSREPGRRPLRARQMLIGEKSSRRRMKLRWLSMTHSYGLSDPQETTASIFNFCSRLYVPGKSQYLARPSPSQWYPCQTWTFAKCSCSRARSASNRSNRQSLLRYSARPSISALTP